MSLLLQPMKIAAIIMALLVLALSSIPCMDRAAFAKSTANTKTGVHQIDKHQQQQDHNDDCSPFCSCNCCAGFSINHQVPTVVKQFSLTLNKSVSFYNADIVEISLPVWQPPQLV